MTLDQKTPNKNITQGIIKSDGTIMVYKEGTPKKTIRKIIKPDGSIPDYILNRG
jgi:hypothetical protein